jgi:dsRNA-specific ribonuclease
MFEVEVLINGQKYGHGKGHSKQAAAKAAAKEAISVLGIE